jgi:predicted transcriptional regulator
VDKDLSVAEPDSHLMQYASKIVSAYVQNNHLAVGDLADSIRNIHRALAGLGSPSSTETSENRKPATSIKKSVTTEYIVCLEDGAKLKMLKRYLRSRYNLSPEQYRAKWNLPRDYPMVAPGYSARRSEFAKKIGLGRTPKEKSVAAKTTGKNASKRKKG